jgi:hypothetical protein
VSRIFRAAKIEIELISYPSFDFQRDIAFLWDASRTAVEQAYSLNCLMQRDFQMELDSPLLHLGDAQIFNHFLMARLRYLGTADGSPWNEHPAAA